MRQANQTLEETHQRLINMPHRGVQHAACTQRNRIGCNPFSRNRHRRISKSPVNWNAQSIAGVARQRTDQNNGIRCAMSWHKPRSRCSRYAGRTKRWRKRANASHPCPIAVCGMHSTEQDQLRSTLAQRTQEYEQIASELERTSRCRNEGQSACNGLDETTGGVAIGSAVAGAQSGSVADKQNENAPTISPNCKTRKRPCRRRWRSRTTSSR